MHAIILQSMDANAELGNIQVYSVALFWALEKVVRCISWQLVLLGPVAYSLEISTCVYGVEVDEWFDV